MKFITILVLTCLVSSAVNAQDSTGTEVNFRQALPASSLNNFSTKKWSVNSFKGISTSFIGWKGGSAMAVSAPFGIQLNRRINNNLSAFGALSIAPTYLSFNHVFVNTDFSKTGFNNSFSQRNNFGLYQRAEIGLSYTNDERTFRISGSIGIERSTNNYMTPYSGRNTFYNSSLSPSGRFMY